MLVRFHVFGELVSFVDRVLASLLWEGMYFHSNDVLRYFINYIPRKEIICPPSSTLIFLSYIPSFYLCLYDYLQYVIRFTNFLFMFVSSSVSRCNPSRYLSGRCGGTTRIGVLVGGKFSFLLELI